MKLLILGQNGNISRALSKNLALSKNYEVLNLGQADFDLRKPGLITSVLNNIKPEVVINAAAYTSVDNAETETEVARLINAVGPGEIAQWCKKNHSKLIHYSTDYVFDGHSKDQWSEDDATHPICYYGETKLEGENNIRSEMDDFLILRISWIFAPEGQNFFRKMLSLAQTRDVLKVINDQTGSPSYSHDIAQGTFKALTKWQAADYTQSGIYHLRNEGFTTWFHFAARIVEAVEKNGLPLQTTQVLPINSNEYPTKANRPKNSKMNAAKIKSTFGVELPSWETALEQCIQIYKTLKEV